MERVRQHPIHATQVNHNMGQDGGIIELKVIVNSDLIERILHFGSKLKVETPDKLRKTVMTELKTAYEAYFQLTLF